MVQFEEVRFPASPGGWKLRSSAGVVIVSPAEKALAGIGAANFDWAPGFYQSLARMSLLQLVFWSDCSLISPYLLPRKPSLGIAQDALTRCCAQKRFLKNILFSKHQINSDSAVSHIRLKLQENIFHLKQHRKFHPPPVFSGNCLFDSVINISNRVMHKNDSSKSFCF